MGMSSNGLSHDQSNSLDEMAAAMINKNAEYAEDLLDHHSEDLPTFHVVHEANSLLDPEPSPAKNDKPKPPAKESKPKPPAKESKPKPAPPSNKDKMMNLMSSESDSLTSSSSESEAQSSEQSSETSSTSTEETSESESENNENDIAHLPYKANPNWSPDDEDFSSDSDRSSSEAEPNYTVPRMQDDVLN